MSYVLVIDDDEDIRDALQMVLEAEGYAAACAGGAEESQAVLQARGAPRVILLDLMMPGTSGEALLRSLRGSASWSAVPVVIISGQTDTLHRLGDLEVSAILLKPFERKEVVSAVRNAGAR